MDIDGVGGYRVIDKRVRALAGGDLSSPPHQWNDQKREDIEKFFEWFFYFLLLFDCV
jgi:hypothetical protein